MGILLEALAAPEGASFAVSEVWLGLCWGNGIAWDAAVLLNLPTDVLIPHPLEVVLFQVLTQSVTEEGQNLDM